MEGVNFTKEEDNLRKMAIEIQSLMTDIATKEAEVIEQIVGISLTPEQKNKIKRLPQRGRWSVSCFCSS